MAKLSLDQYAKELERRLKVLQQDDKPLRIAAQETHIATIKRTYRQGIKSNGSKIGQYSNKPLYIKPNTAPKGFTPAGKTGNTKFASGKAHKTKWFKSYKAFRASQGREAAFINLNLHGRLETNHANGLKQKGKHVWITQVRPNNSKKMRGNERKFGKIANLTPLERKRFFVIIRQELAKVLRGD